MPFHIKTNFDQLIEDLQNTGKDIQKGVRRGLSDAGRTGKARAATSAIERSNSKGKRDSRGNIGKQVRAKTKYQVTDNDVRITMRDRMDRSLASYANKPSGTKDDYRGRGVEVEHFGKRRIFTRHAAFIREMNGGRVMAWRRGNRDIGGAFYARAHSDTMIDDETADPVIDEMQGRFFRAIDRAFKRR